MEMTGKKKAAEAAIKKVVQRNLLNGAANQRGQFIAIMELPGAIGA